MNRKARGGVAPFIVLTIIIFYFANIAGFKTTVDNLFNLNPSVPTGETQATPAEPTQIINTTNSSIHVAEDTAIDNVDYGSIELPTLDEGNYTSFENLDILKI